MALKAPAFCRVNHQGGIEWSSQSGWSKLPSFHTTKSGPLIDTQEKYGKMYVLQPSRSTNQRLINATLFSWCWPLQPSVGSLWFPQWPWWNTGTSATQPKSPECNSCWQSQRNCTQTYANCIENVYWGLGIHGGKIPETQKLSKQPQWICTVRAKVAPSLPHKPSGIS